MKAITKRGAVAAVKAAEGMAVGGVSATEIELIIDQVGNELKDVENLLKKLRRISAAAPGWTYRVEPKGDRFILINCADGESAVLDATEVGTRRLLAYFANQNRSIAMNAMFDAGKRGPRRLEGRDLAANPSDATCDASAFDESLENGVGEQKLFDEIGDDKTIRAIYAEISRLKAEMDEAEGRGDADSFKSLEAKKDALVERLREYIRGCKLRVAPIGDHSRKAVHALRMSIDRAITQVEKQAPRLGNHLRKSISRNGSFCYSADPQLHRWNLDAVIGTVHTYHKKG